jgi:hypothetical protein
MNKIETRDDVDMIIRRIGVIWVIMLVMVGVYIGATLFISYAQVSVFLVDNRFHSMIVGSFSLFAGLEAIALWFLDRRFRSKKSVERFFHGGGATAINTKLPDPSSLSENGLRISLLPHFLQSSLVKWAMSEAIAMMGVVVSFTTGGLVAPAIFYALAAMLLMATKPSIKELDEMVHTIRS